MYDKHATKLLGSWTFGGISNQLDDFKESCCDKSHPIATLKMEYPYTHFP